MLDIYDELLGTGGEQTETPQVELEKTVQPEKENTTAIDIGEISRMLLNNDDIDSSGDLDEYMANKLVEYVQRGKLSEDAAREFAKRQRFVENGYMENYDNIYDKNNIIVKKTEIPYSIAILKKESELLRDNAINTNIIDQSNRLNINSMVNLASVRSVAKKSKIAENSYHDAEEYGKELFTHILNGITYNLGDTRITELEAFAGVLRANKRLINLDGVLGRDTFAPRLKLSDIFDVDILTDSLKDLTHLLIDMDILRTLVLKSKSKNPLDDLFKQSNLQVISIMRRNGRLYTFNCNDTGDRQRTVWLKLRKDIISRQKMHLSSVVDSITKWSTQFYGEALMLQVYTTDDMPTMQSFRTKLFAEQGSVMDRVKSRINQLSKTATTKAVELKEKQASKPKKQKKVKNKGKEGEADGEIHEDS